MESKKNNNISLLKSLYLEKKYQQILDIYMKNRDIFLNENFVEAGDLILNTIINIQDQNLLDSEISILENKPYISQEVEEWLRQINEYRTILIKAKNQKSNDKTFDIFILISKLNSENIEDLVWFLNAAKDEKLAYINFDQLIDDNLQKRENYDLHFALLFEKLLHDKCDFAYLVNVLGKKMVLNTKEGLNNYLENNPVFLKIYNYFSMTEKNISIKNQTNRIFFHFYNYFYFQKCTKEFFDDCLLFSLRKASFIYGENFEQDSFISYFKNPLKDLKNIEEIYSKISSLDHF